MEVAKDRILPEVENTIVSILHETEKLYRTYFLGKNVVTNQSRRQLIESLQEKVNWLDEQEKQGKV